MSQCVSASTLCCPSFAFKAAPRASQEAHMDTEGDAGQALGAKTQRRARDRRELERLDQWDQIDTALPLATTAW